MKKLITIITAVVIGSASVASATTKWAQGPLSDWFQSLHSPSGFLCCGEEDGIQDPPYKENDDGTYDVYYHNSWHHALKESIVKATSKVAYPIVWPGYEDNVRCFLPGARS